MVNTGLAQNLETLKSKTFHFCIPTSTNIPVEYTLEEREDYELPVFGTYIHKHILPGFRYRVRLTSTKEYLFGGKALKLESIGKGYGKRITFESDDILENSNFFWSDSHEEGFAFSPELLSRGDVFQVVDAQRKSTGIFSIENVNEEQQITGVTHEKDVANVHARVHLRGMMRLLSSNAASTYEEDIPLAGEVVIKVNRFSSTFYFLKTVEHEVLGNAIDLHFVKHYE